MTPAARCQAAIEVLDRVTTGIAAEQALTNWARGARFAGSKDRAAVRDHVYTVIRCQRSCAAHGGGEAGRALILGLLRAEGADPADVFTGEGYGPEPLTDAELSAGRTPDSAEAMDMPDWLLPRLKASLPEVEPTALALRERAPVFLRVNRLRGTVDVAQESLLAEGIATQPHALSPSALEVTEGARRVHLSRAYAEGLVELQDAASQAVVDQLPLRAGMRVLDYCAGGGGKALAMAARLSGPVEAHDADPRRMSDLPKRAERAGAQIARIDRPGGLYDLILCDAPCSGSGAWRRSPEGKWALTEARLQELQDIQLGILREASAYLTTDGHLAYVTCSILSDENDTVIDRFLADRPDWRVADRRQFLPVEGGDGFFLALMSADA
ncbi:RsmB/NOP family class I SAM-dependent RNA methyltransferase [Primorskyibacter flagellatus]|uniref:16S rRNA (Cytosine967-C5)-methyltransferase n=1 Tax=Primorskyibacter flagellatus TaxID=1387277 RepID=A0A1W1Z0E9_9RHOB|nr:RsmB/NOP family class I SAM-dependent RNA methyltransferase [Primorskyibacter flagellatus]SMC41802.1 16S rRNA (cytosine967-C5)-methyltransferase [Primorskyibacter flagellatus]